MSLRRRVLLGCLAVAVVLLAADLVLAATFRSYLLARTDEQLVQIAGRVGPERGPGGPGPGGPRAFSEFFIGVADAQGRLVGRLDRPIGDNGASPEPDPGQVVARAAAPGETPEPFTTGTFGPDGWRIVSLRPPGGSELLVIGAQLDEAGATYTRVVAVLAWATAAVLATLALVAWWVLRQGVRPLAAMASTAGAIAGGALSERVADADERTEAGRLGLALNAMLARIEEAFAHRAATEERLRRFVADASHELRTPLTSIRGYADLYRQGALGDEEALAGAMRRIEQEATRMGVLTEDLLLLARLDQGRPPEVGRVRLDVLVHDAVRDARAVEPDRPFALAADPVTVDGDESRLHQAVGNLLANARVHTPEGAPVRVSVAADHGWGVVEVADSGPGLQPEVAGRVFERFYRADTARTRAIGGTGLGLAIVAAVAEAHGGCAEVDSAPGQGARFRIRLPLADPAELPRPEGGGTGCR